MDISSVNDLPYEQFMDVFGNVVERCPIVTAAMWLRRPFVTFNDLEDAISKFIDALPLSGKEGLLRCLSDLAGRDLRNGTLSQESSEEQEAAGMYALSPEDFALMDRLNTEYKQRFGFPFVLCARMNDRASILRQLSECCRNGREAEVARGIGEVKKICRLRLEALVHVDRHGDAAKRC